MEVIVGTFKQWGLVALLVIPSASFASSAYKTVGPNGEISYSSTPPQTGKTVSKIDIGGETVTTDESDPKKAAAMVIGVSRAVNMMSSFCRVNVPDTAHEHEEAQSQWNARHAKLMSAANRVLSNNLSPSDQSIVNSLLSRVMEAYSSVLTRIPRDKQLKLCVDLPQHYKDYKINLIDHGKLVNTLLSYK